VLIAYLLGLLTVVLVLKPGASRSRVVAVILAAMWGWSGIAYHWLYFTTINPAALLFGAAFVVQGLIFLEAAWGNRLLLAFRRTTRGFVGLALIAYATLVIACALPRRVWCNGLPRQPPDSVAAHESVPGTKLPIEMSAHQSAIRSKAENICST
jgi:hypothetical protein